jgi:O-antigen chain-terminating methyltransferase
MTDHFYSAFEDRYRGSRELIKSRQMVYRPFIEKLQTQGRTLKALDVGCGRGEWLELLRDWGIEAEGVDLDDSMLRVCYEMGLAVSNQDALVFLTKAPSASLDIISGFHIAEHLEFSQLVTLVKESLRALRPGGLLILETPNSENINVATSSFYLDPTHHNPIPIQLLGFLFSFTGFPVVEEVRLNADISSDHSSWISLNDVISGVSRDYAVIGQAPLSPEGQEALSIVGIELSKGVTYRDLVGKFDDQAHRVNERIRDVDVAANLKFQQLQAASDEQIRNANLKIEQLQWSTGYLGGRIQRLEAPFRIIKQGIRFGLSLPQRLVRGIKNGILDLFRKIKALIKPLLLSVIRALGLYDTLYAYYYRHRDRVDYEALNPRAKEVYQVLKDELCKKKRFK